MKAIKMFLLVGLVAFLTAFSAQGQVYTLLQPYGGAVDTVTNTGTAYVSTVAVSPAHVSLDYFWKSYAILSSQLDGDGYNVGKLLS